jgi:predicted metal-dependent HD superfamily phosphohydrolase
VVVELDELRRAGSDDLRARHAELHRRYHTGEHVSEVLAEVARLLPFEPDADPEAVVLAARFHDAIYDVRAGGGASEDASARLAAVDVRAAGGAPSLAEEVARLVRLTAGHTVAPGDRSGAVLVDADLWILSAPPERYDRYVADVRVEYAHVPDATWRTGRGQVLDRFLAAAEAGELYGAGPVEDRAARRGRAAANLARERQSLG